MVMLKEPILTVFRFGEKEDFLLFLFSVFIFTNLLSAQDQRFFSRDCTVRYTNSAITVR
jgi:hypothetical protein